MSKTPIPPKATRRTSLPVIPPSIQSPLKRSIPARKSYVPPRSTTPSRNFFDERGNYAVNSTSTQQPKDEKKKYSTIANQFNWQLSRGIHTNSIRDLMPATPKPYPKVQQPRDNHCPIHAITREELHASAKSLLMEKETLQSMPSVNSGVLLLSCPFKGSETYLTHVVEDLSHSLGTDLLIVNNRDVFDRVLPQKALETKVDIQQGRSNGRRGTTIVLPSQSNRMQSLSGVLLPPNLGDEDEVSRVPYPFFRNYWAKDGAAMIHFWNNPPTPSHKSPASVFSQQLEMFFRSLTTSKEKLVILWQDFSLLFARNPDLSETDIMQALVGCLEDVRRMRPVLLVLPFTTLVPKMEKQSPIEMMMGMGARINSREEEEKKDKGVSYDTPVDAFLGVVKVNVLPPSPAHVSTWSVQENAWVSGWNWNEIESTLAWSKVGLGRERFDLGDAILDIGDVEKICLNAMSHVDSNQVDPEDVFHAYKNLGAAKIATGSSHPHLGRDLKGLNKYEENILRESLVDPTDISMGGFTDIGGLSKTKAILHDLVRLPLLHPSLFTGVLQQTTTGILMFGPPGTGKTLLAKAVSKEAGVRMLSISQSVIGSMFVGENEKYARAIFSLAAKLAPCIVFIDEIDALLRARRSGMMGWERNTINEIMLSWDGIKSKKGVLVMGATNRPWDLDEAVLRRLPRRVLVDLPDESERREILNVVLAEEDVQDKIRAIDEIVEKTRGWSGSDLKNLSIAAALISVREALQHGTDERVLKLEHFERALAQGDVVPSLNDRTELVKLLKDWDREYGSKGNVLQKLSMGF
jgi:MoxR-like ATPase